MVRKITRRSIRKKQRIKGKNDMLFLPQRKRQSLSLLSKNTKYQTPAENRYDYTRNNSVREVANKARLNEL
jgi:hypothetical protein